MIFQNHNRLFATARRSLILPLRHPHRLSSTVSATDSANEIESSIGNTIDNSISSTDIVTNNAENRKRSWLLINQLPLFTNVNDILFGLKRMGDVIQDYNNSNTHSLPQIEGDEFDSSGSEGEKNNNDNYPLKFDWRNLQEMKYFVTPDYLLRGFYLRFDDPQHVQSIIKIHNKKNWPKLGVAWTSVTVKAKYPNLRHDSMLKIGGDTLRVVPYMNDITANDIRGVFEHYGLADERRNNPAIIKADRKNSSHDKKPVYLVKFESVEAARMAHRFENRDRRPGNMRLFTRIYPDLTLPDLKQMDL